MRNFIILLLADLASKSLIHHFDNSEIKTACLRTDYKRIIEDIMYEENGWGIKFATLINIYSYYEFQLDWERKFASTLKEVLVELNKTIEFDFENDSIRVDFTSEEIEAIKSQYDEETLSNMDHFSNLIDDIIFTRNFKLNVKDMKRDDARFKHHLEDLSIKTTYANKIKLAKPLNDSNYHKINHIDKRKVKFKILDLFKRK